MEIIKKDSAFFSANNIIDYSLLVGVHNRSEHPKDFAGNCLVHKQDPQLIDTRDKRPFNDLESQTTFTGNADLFY